MWLPDFLSGRVKRRRIVAFAPNAFFPSMITAPLIVSKVLAEAGHHVSLITCSAERQNCTVMDGLAPTDPRPARKFCPDCRMRAEDYPRRYGISVTADGALLTPDDRVKIARMQETVGSDPRTFEIDGIHIGLLAAGNLSAIWKRDVFTTVDQDILDRMRIMVKDGLRSYVIAQRAVELYRPDIFLYYAEYYTEIIYGSVFGRCGIRVVPVVHSGLNGNDFRKIQIIDQMPQVLDMQRRLPTWRKWRDLPLNSNEVIDVVDDSITRILGRSGIVFSPTARDLNSLTDQLDPDRRTFVAFTSSDDELNNTKQQRQLFTTPSDDQPEAFNNQIDWLRAISQFVAENHDHQLIVRFHPRLAANHRSNVQSEYGAQVEAVKAFNCDRIHVVLPESSISSYAIAQLADLVLTSWTSMGVECVRLGLPSLQAFRGVDIFPKEDVLNYTQDRTTYMSRLKQHQSVSARQFLWSMRYTQMLLCGLAVDVGDLISDFDDPTLPEYRKPACAPEVIDTIIRGKSLSEQRLRQRRRSTNHLSEAAEKAEVCQSIARLIHVLAFWADARPNDIRFEQGTDKNPGVLEHDSLIVRDALDGQVCVSFKEKTVTVHSQAIKNLRRLYGDLSNTALG